MAVHISSLADNTDPDQLAQRTRLSGRGRDYLSQQWLVDLNPTPSYDGKELVDSDALLHGQIENLIATLVGAEHFEPTFGCNILLRVFSPAVKNNTTDDILYLLENDLLMAMDRNLSDKIRVSHGDTRIVVSDNDESYEITVVGWVYATQRNSTYQFSVRKP